MKYTIDYGEVIRKNNSITIEVNDEEEGEWILNELAERAEDFEKPDDIFASLRDMGVTVVETREGTEEYECDVQ